MDGGRALGPALLARSGMIAGVASPSIGVDARNRAWVAAALGKGTRVTAARSLRGGIASSVHALTVEHGDTRSSVVLRRYPEPDADGPRQIRSEATTLSLLSGTGVGA